MELTVTQETLTHALSAVSRVANTKTQLPILSNILLRTDGNRLLVAATNLEIAITQYIGAKVTKPGAITIPARLMSEFISSLPKESVKLKVLNDKNELATIMETLSEEDKKIMRLRHIEGLSFKQISEIFKKSINTLFIQYYWA